MQVVSITSKGRKFLEEARSRDLDPIPHTLHNQHAVALQILDTGGLGNLTPKGLKMLQDVGYITIITTN